MKSYDFIHFYILYDKLIFVKNFHGDIVGPIKPGRRKIVTITVTVPVDARSGDKDRVTITATSQFDLSVSDSSFSAIIVR